MLASLSHIGEGSLRLSLSDLTHTSPPIMMAAAGPGPGLPVSESESAVTRHWVWKLELPGVAGVNGTGYRVPAKSTSESRPVTRLPSQVFQLFPASVPSRRRVSDDCRAPRLTVTARLPLPRRRAAAPPHGRPGTGLGG